MEVGEALGKERITICLAAGVYVNGILKELVAGGCACRKVHRGMIIRRLLWSEHGIHLDSHVAELEIWWLRRHADTNSSRGTAYSMTVEMLLLIKPGQLQGASVDAGEQMRFKLAAMAD